MKINLVFLPATEPTDSTYGVVPAEIDGWPEVSVYRVHYSRQVWYNRPVRDEAIAQIRAFNASPIVLVGFSKSGLGAWNIARMIPDLVSGTIIFDAPVVRDTLPPWGTAPFYADDLSWQRDLPMRTIDEFQAAVPEAHQLVLISGANFHNEMCQFSDVLSGIGLAHTFLSRLTLRHHWNSGWIEQGLCAMLGQGRDLG